MFSNFKTTQNRKEGKMKKLIKTSFSFFAVFALMITFSLQQVTAAEKIRWKVQSTFNTGWPALGDPVARLSDTLDRATDGRIKLKVYEPGKILPPLEIHLQLVKVTCLQLITTWHMTKEEYQPLYYLQLYHLVWNHGNMQLGGLKVKVLS